MFEVVKSDRQRALTAARLVGACALGVVSQIAVHMPEGYFGTVDQVTPFGLGYATGLVALTGGLLVALRLRLRSRLIGWLVPLVLAVNVGLFVPALAADPVVAGLVIVWNLVLLTQHFFPTTEEPAALRPDRGSEVADRLWRVAPALRHLAIASLALTIAVVGYRLTGRALAQWVCLVLCYGTLIGALPVLRLLYRQGSRAVLLLVVPVAGSVLAAASPPVMLSLLAIAQAILLLLILSQQQTTLEVLRDFFDHPSRLIVASFATAILVGTVLLTFPAASAGEEAVEPLDALFTATSATCVTGLIVLDTPHDFSLFGQAVILVLIQVGGLGIMTLSTFAALILGGNLGLRGERALTEMLDLQTAPTAYRLTRFIVLSTLAVEAVGAAGLTVSFAGAGLPWGQAIWRGVFHSISAFCNAGFALQSDSLVLFQRSPVPVLIHALLITLGGLGFIVLAGVWNRIVRRGGRPLSVQVRTVLATSGVLVVSGTLLYGVCEWHRTLAGLSIPDKVVNALFQSVTLRTAGFNTVDFTHLGSATALFMILFMFVGASPGSTGGGIKTTTATVLLAAIRSTARRGAPVRLFRREVPRDIVYRSLAILVISAGVVFGGFFLLLLFENQPFLNLLFETVSAFGTVGLSMGATTSLGPTGKLIIVGIMFVGRTGPLTIALLLGTSAERRVLCRYPETRLMVG